jgi:hypothetical protein
MRTISTCRAAATLALTLFAAGGCSNGPKSAGVEGGSAGNNSGGSGGGGGGTPTAKGTCDNPQIDILFSPMYSAYDGVHTFKIPAVVDGLAASALTWSASDPSMVDIQNDPGTGGVMITTRKAGNVKIIATAGALCGVSSLTIAQAASDDWMVGSARYNDGIVLGGVPRGNNIPDSGVNPREAACTNCHGDTATMLQFRTVSHSPTQTGGFSDDDLTNIITKAMVPLGGYFDTSIVSYDGWQRFHHWEMTPEQIKGIIVYLRSLTPQSQGGTRGDFGGGMRTDGGFRRGDGGGRRGDGGGRQGDGGGGGDPADASSSTD